MRLFLATTALLLFAGPPLAQESEDEDTVYPDDESVPSVNCIRPKMIRATRVIDGRNILFQMRSRKYYRNVLPRVCRPLAQGFAFSYNSTYGRVCAVDTITIVTGGNAGYICPLGKFYPMSAEEVAALLNEVQVSEELGIEKEPQ